MGSEYRYCDRGIWGDHAGIGIGLFQGSRCIGVMLGLLGLPAGDDIGVMGLSGYDLE